jgi:hypothetical protein
MKHRCRFKRDISLEELFARDAQDCRERAEQLPPGKERDMLLKRARQAVTAARINKWISSPGLLPTE